MCLKQIFTLIVACSFLPLALWAQPAQQPSLPVFNGALAAKRASFYNRTVNETILANLNSNLNSENEEKWIAAFSAINLLQYKTDFSYHKIDSLAHHLTGRSIEFKKAFLELINSDYPKKYIPQVKEVLKDSLHDAALIGMAANYIMQSGNENDIILIKFVLQNALIDFPGNIILTEMLYRASYWQKPETIPNPAIFFSPNYLPGQILVISLQRKNRNYAGLVIVRRADGSFVRNPDSSIFHVGQLARSASNMPSVISMGNTPQGIFRMDGFDVSKGYFIGPTTNIQLTMPFEFKASHFFNNMNDSTWSIEKYESLLPKNFVGYHPMYETYYAGKAGRNEIIAHGTTLNPEYYKDEPYYPFTPTAGCLATEECWAASNGMLVKSGQLKLVNAIKEAGGPHGYFIVLNIDNMNAPVTMADIENYIK